MEVEVEKEMEMRDFRLRGCGAEGAEAGQMGESFAKEAEDWGFVEGVRAGTQKDGRVGLEAFFF